MTLTVHFSLGQIEANQTQIQNIQMSFISEGVLQLKKDILAGKVCMNIGNNSNDACSESKTSSHDFSFFVT